VNSLTGELADDLCASAHAFIAHPGSHLVLRQKAELETLTKYLELLLVAKELAKCFDDLTMEVPPQLVTFLGLPAIAELDSAPATPGPAEMVGS